MSKSRGARRFGWACFVAAMLLAVSGCGTSPYFPPAGVAHIDFRYEHSPRVIVEKAWFVRRGNGPLELTGYVSAAAEGVSTTGTRLEVTLRDVRGAVLWSAPAIFEPRQIPARVNLRGGVSYFTMPVSALPPGAARVTVSARDS